MSGPKDEQKPILEQAKEEIMEGVPLWAQDYIRKYGKQTVILFVCFIITIFVIIGAEAYFKHVKEISATKLGLAMMIKNPDQRLVALKQVIEQEPHTDAGYQAQLLLGAAYRDLGMLKQAKEAYKKAEEDFSKNSVLKDSAMMGLGYVNESLKDFKGAMVEYQKVSTRHHGYDAIAYRDLGRVAFKLGDYSKAQSALNNYLTLRPDAPDIGFIRYELSKIEDKIATQEAKKFSIMANPHDK